jgi:tryptophanyl-tRNA synthetase
VKPYEPIPTALPQLICGLDVNKVVFYRQSDVPQTAELSGI